MKRLIACVLLLVCVGVQNLSAQTVKQIKGRVVDDSTGAPLSGVSVSVKGTATGTTTDNNGAFTIRTTAPGSVTLNISSTGYTNTSAVAGNGEVNVRLKRLISSLDDVVVVGYQAVRRKDLTASVSSVSARDLKDIPINSAAEALNGRLAGVTATTAEGSPDAAIRIRVRGGMSINGDNNPLYVIDGVQVENGLSTISPQDIQSIDVLKDAAATSIYGARGANGVIIITTKGGRVGKPTLSYNGFVGVKNLRKELDVMSPYEFVVYQSERVRGSSTDSSTFTKNFGTTWDTLNVYKNIDPVDWQKEVFGRTGITTTHNLNLNGGNKVFTYNFGYTYNNDKAIVINSNYKRHLLNFKGDYKVTKNLKVGATSRYTNQNVYGAGVSDEKGSSYNRLRNAVKYRPFLSSTQDIDDADPLADPNVGNGLNLINPIALANAEYRRKTTDAYNVSLNANYNITKNLSFRSTFGYDNNKTVDRQFSDSITPYAIIQGAKKPIAGLDTTERTIITNSNVFTYNLRLGGGKHALDFIAGEETYDQRNKFNSTLLRNLPLNTSPTQAFDDKTLGTQFVGYPKVAESRFTILSFFGRMNYNLNNKYLLSFNMRADASSKFAEGKKWGYFPSGSFAWRMKQENFLKNADFLNDLKLRLGYGKVGNNRIADYLYITTFSNSGNYYYGVNNQAILAYYSTALANPNLTWESTINRNIGLDVSLLKGKLDFSVDYYRNSSSNLLLNVPIAPTYGYTQQQQNVGKTSNKGIEFQLNATLVRTNKFSWTANFNVSHNKNRIEALGPNQQYYYPAASWGVSGQPTDYIVRVGDPVGAMWGLVTDGYYLVSDFNYNNGVYTLKPGVVSDAGIIGTVQPGAIKFKDLDGNGTIDMDKDRTIIGNPNPDLTGGLNQQLTYGSWDMSVFVNFATGFDVYNANKIEFTNGYTANSNLLSIMEGRWRTVTATGATAQYVTTGGQVVGIPPDQLAALNTNVNIWQPIKSAGAFYPHSWAIEDGTFLRLNNVTIGYSVPVKKLVAMKMSKMRFYITANNLAVITKYSGYDPEVSVRSNPVTPGLDYSAYPKSRSFVFGVNVTF